MGLNLLALIRNNNLKKNEQSIFQVKIVFQKVWSVKTNCNMACRSLVYLHWCFVCEIERDSIVLTDFTDRSICFAAVWGITYLYANGTNCMHEFKSMHAFYTVQFVERWMSLFECSLNTLKVLTSHVFSLYFYISFSVLTTLFMNYC